MYIPLRERSDNCFFINASMKPYNPLFEAFGACGKSGSSEMSAAERSSINRTWAPHCAHLGKRSPLKIVAAWLGRCRSWITVYTPDSGTSSPDLNVCSALDAPCIPRVPEEFLTTQCTKRLRESAASFLAAIVRLRSGLKSRGSGPGPQAIQESRHAQDICGGSLCIAESSHRQPG
jgi:hypothetical protein